MFTILKATLLDWNEVPTTLIYCTIIFFLCLKCKRQHDNKSALLAKKLQQNNIEPMPTPPAMPIIGHIHLLRDHQHNPWDGFEEIRKQYGNVVSLKMGIHSMVLVSSSETMREILLKKCDIFSNRPNFQRHHIIFGGDKENSLALCNWSNTHRDRRKMCRRGIVPNRFSSRNQLLENIISKFVVNYIDDISKQEPVLETYSANKKREYSNTTQQQEQKLGINHIIYSNKDDNPMPYKKTTKEDILFLTSDIFMDFLCSEKRSHSNPIYKEFVLGCDFVFWDINQMYLIDFLPFLTSLGIGRTYLRKLKRVTDFLRNYIDDEIFDPRLEKHSKLDRKFYDFESSSTENTTDSEGTVDYLDSIILEHLANVNSMSLADYKVGFADLLAGHAAVANILMRVLGHLALDRKIQDMISEEAEAADIYNQTTKPSLPITEASMQEALRLASSPIVPHVAREDTSIEKYYVPEGAMVLFNNYHINLSDSLYINPLEFNPLRFLESCENDSGKPQYKLNLPKHFMPFSVGLRTCLGKTMVETTTIVLVANLCRKYIFEANDENLVRHLLSPKGSVALNPDAECFELKLYPR